MGASCGKPEEEKTEGPMDEEPEKDPAIPVLTYGGPQLITVAIVGARGLRNTDWVPGTGTSDCYCVLKVAGLEDEVHRTKVLNNTLEPVWKEEAKVKDFNPDKQSLEFFVWDADFAGYRDFLGKVKLPGTHLLRGGYNGELELEEAGKDTSAYLRIKVRLEDHDYPPGPPPEVQMTLQKEPGTAWGLSLDSQDGTRLFVISAEAGPAKSYNEKAEPEMQLKHGDFIISVNGEQGDAMKMLSQCKKSRKLDLVVRRPMEFTVVVEKGDKEPLGLEFVDKAVGTALVVTKVTEKWKPVTAENQVEKGDRVIAIGSKRGNVDALAADLRSKRGSFQVTFVRPATQDSSWSFW